MHGYKLCNDSEIDFDKFNLIRDKGKQFKDFYIYDNQEMIKNIKLYCDENKIDYDYIIKKFVQDYAKSNPNINEKDTKDRETFIKSYIDTFMKTHLGTPVSLIKNDDYYNNDIIMALTESPTYTIYKWASKEYSQNGITKAMVSTGIHTINEWISVIFQLLIAFHIMVKYNIYFPEFLLQDNVFIKELSDVQSNPKCWKYIVNGIEHYVPNYGYLVMVNSKYKDIATDEKHKVYGSFDKKDNKNYGTKIINKLLDCLNPGNFNNSIFQLNNGVKPDENVIEFIGRIHDYVRDNKVFSTTLAHAPITTPTVGGVVDDSQNNVNYNVFIDCINNNIFNFLNNRIGTELSMDEHGYIFENSNILTNANNVNIGQFMLYKNSKIPSTYYIVQALSKNENGVIQIYNRNNGSIDNSKVGPEDLYELPLNYNFKQIATQVDGSREISDIIETYNIEKM
jgi:hypothetical protein